jgi:acetoin utilization deacetylase AcuC-like enzyme
MKPLPVMYCEPMVAPAQGGSPSAEKPRKLIEAWQVAGMALDVRAPRPVSPAQLSLAHDPDYVAAVLACRRPNGFGTRSAQVARSLPYTTGAMLDGARLALRERTAVCAPVSGFHHAGYDHGSGFCTFNGLMVTALQLRIERPEIRIAIVDCDQHYGDGTDGIIEYLGGLPWLRHFTAGEKFHEPSHWDSFVLKLGYEMGSLVREKIDLVLYQAGADPHINDPLGGWLTTEQLRQRDAWVFEACKRFGVPVCWNLAGGYQKDAAGSIAPVLAIHTNTALEHLRVFCADP